MSDPLSEKYPPDLRDRLMEIETSVRSDIPCPGGGRIVTLGFPGLAFDVQGNTYIDKERMDATLADRSLEPCRLLTVLLEEEEVPDEAWRFLSEAASRKSIRIEHLPIKDYEAPDAAFQEKWRSLEPDIRALLAAGGTVALSCHYGAGRSGTIAASLLMDHGFDAAAAIETVRGYFPESIESERQLDWLKRKAR